MSNLPIMFPGPHYPTLSEFVLARIAEDAAILRTFEDDIVGPWPPVDKRGYYLVERGDENSSDLIAVDPWRLQAECRAKQHVVEAYLNAQRWPMRQPAQQRANLAAFETVLGELVLPYAAHPDCRDEWGPVRPV